MADQNDDLEEQCENAVFQICCTRERYSTRCANQLEKQLALTRKNLTSSVLTAPVKDFEVPVITSEQQELFQAMNSSESQLLNAKKDSTKKNVLSSLKEMQSILNMIEKSKNSEIYKLLTE